MASKAKEKGGRSAKNGKAANDDDFDRGGPDGARKQRGMGDNGAFEPDGDQIAEFLEVVDRHDAELAAIDERMRLKTQPDREARKKVAKKTSDAKGSIIKDHPGLGAKELDALIRAHRMKRDSEKVQEELDDNPKQRFKLMVASLTGFETTPLARSAADRESVGA